MYNLHVHATYTFWFASAWRLQRKLQKTFSEKWTLTNFGSLSALHAQRSVRGEFIEIEYVCDGCYESLGFIERGGLFTEKIFYGARS